jgi:hypothetical protein
MFQDMTSGRASSEPEATANGASHSVRFRALLAMHKWLVDMPSGGTVALAGS